MVLLSSRTKRRGGRDDDNMGNRSPINHNRKHCSEIGLILAGRRHNPRRHHSHPSFVGTTTTIALSSLLLASSSHWGRGGVGGAHSILHGTNAAFASSSSLAGVGTGGGWGGGGIIVMPPPTTMDRSSSSSLFSIGRRGHLDIATPEGRRKHDHSRRPTALGPLFVVGGGTGGDEIAPTSSSSSSSSSSSYSSSAIPAQGAKSSFERQIRKVTVVGGTHGNEYTGIWCIKAIERQRETMSPSSSPDDRDDVRSDDAPHRLRRPMNVFEHYPSLKIDTLLGNPVAYMRNRRFVDVDLNREFSIEKLRKVPDDKGYINLRKGGRSSVHGGVGMGIGGGGGGGGGGMDDCCDVRTDFCSDEIRSSLPHEAIRAREIEGLLGPKFVDVGQRGSIDDVVVVVDANVDVVIDLHTTTSNMGISLIIPEGDELMSAAAAYVLHECKRAYGIGTGDDDDGDVVVQCLMHALPRRQDRMNLSSCGRHGFTIEVGPTPQGVLRHDCVEKTQVALNALLEFFHLRNLELEEEERRRSFGGANTRDDDAPPSSHPPVPSHHRTKILDRLEGIYPGGIVPCYRSAPATRPGELSGKISWPNDPTNPNFPALMVHNSIQDRDFGILRTGDPLFVDLDGNVVPYDGSHGDEVYVIFVNEGGYYYASSGTGVGVAVRSQFDWRTGWFVFESDDEGGASEEVLVEESDSYE